MKITILISLLSLKVLMSWSQTAEQNMVKYWKHRDQLKQYVYEGANVNPTTEHGSYLVQHSSGHGQIVAKNAEFGAGLNSGMLYDSPYYNRCGGLKFEADGTVTAIVNYYFLYI